MDALKGLLNSRKFMAIIVGVICTIGVQKGWFGEVSPEQQAKFVEVIVWLAGAFIVGTAVEDGAKKLGGGEVAKPKKPK